MSTCMHALLHVYIICHISLICMWLRGQCQLVMMTNPHDIESAFASISQVFQATAGELVCGLLLCADAAAQDAGLRLMAQVVEHVMHPKAACFDSATTGSDLVAEDAVSVRGARMTVEKAAAKWCTARRLPHNHLSFDNST